jgi:hypothetical protein
MAVAANKSGPLGLDRRCEQVEAMRWPAPRPLTAWSLGNNKETRAHKIQADHAQIETLLVRKGVGTLDKKTREVVIDLDATDDLLHGSQQGRFFHGYYGNCCYLPLYAFIGEVPVWAELRASQSDASKGSLRALAGHRRRDSPALPAHPHHRAGGQRFLPRNS